ncbi:hypothetical protein LEMLEM_LOCUS11899 [Lemmus lemmus]
MGHASTSSIAHLPEPRVAPQPSRNDKEQREAAGPEARLEAPWGSRLPGSGQRTAPRGGSLREEFGPPFAHFLRTPAPVLLQPVEGAGRLHAELGRAALGAPSEPEGSGARGRAGRGGRGEGGAASGWGGARGRGAAGGAGSGGRGRERGAAAAAAAVEEENMAAAESG